MRIPFTKYGMPQVFLLPLAILVLMGIILWAGVALPSMGIAMTIEFLLAIVLVWALSFFRDPVRNIPTAGGILLSPADGTITDIEEFDDEWVGKSVRVGIFLSIFNVHINRVPCGVRVEGTAYKEGFYTNAMNPESGKVNESNRIEMVRLVGGEKIAVRQISGAIARRIVCKLEKGQQVVAGEQFGMLKFGSRTELIFGAESFSRQVEIGDKVKAGETIFARLRS
jgi:phosphatidylserine decarboxylase